MYLVKTKILSSSIAGKGYFADEDIPQGTIIYFYGEKDKRYAKEDIKKLSEKEKEHLIEFAVENEFGGWVETITGPYTNHSCNPNILPLFIQGAYVDIVVRDIKKNDEITIDYGQFFSSVSWEMKCNCNEDNCRSIVGFGLKTDLETEKYWEKQIQSALEKVNDVPQPIYDSSDKYAREISTSIRQIKKPVLGKQIKFSLIENGG